MMDIYQCFVSYLKEYISILTKGREEFFLSLCDIEEELLQKIQIPNHTEYQIVIIKNKDYSEAVRLRNDAGVKKIVLLSGEGIKQIDSLKDFNEYPLLSGKREEVLDCLSKALNVELERDIRNFLETILEQDEISLWELLRYLLPCMDERNVIQPVKLNENLPELGIWKSRSQEVLKKGKIRRMMRLSKYDIVEKRLTKAVMNHEIENQSWEKAISNGLYSGELSKIFKKLDYEDMEKHLKNAPKDRGMNVAETDSSAADVVYGFSYEYKIREYVKEEISVLEEEWLKEREKDNFDFDLKWEDYSWNRDDESRYREQMEEIKSGIRNKNLPPDKREELIQKVDALEQSFLEAWDGVLEATPICLHTFCKRAEGYTDRYFELLAYILTDEKVRHFAAPEPDLIPRLQCLFCNMEDSCIVMPFFHPVCVFYYMGIKKMFEFILDSQDESGIGRVKDSIQTALLKKLGMQFPVEFMKMGGIYALDYNTVWQSKEVKFSNIENGIVYSVLDFVIIQKQILDYIRKHPLLTEITVALVDISDLGGLTSLVQKIRKIAMGNVCNVARITFLVLTVKEEEFKQKLSRMWDTASTNGLIQFRFGRTNYLNENKYDMEKIAGEADMVVLADSSILYRTPRAVSVKQNQTVVWNQLEGFRLDQQVEYFFRVGKTYIPYLWDTLQYITDNGAEGLWIWKSREIDNGILDFIKKQVSRNPEKTIVALSSNEHILSDIYQNDYIQAHKRKHNGKSIMILNFDSKNTARRLPVTGEPRIGYSVREFYQDSLGAGDITKEILPDAEDIYLEIWYVPDGFRCKCGIMGEDTEEKEEDWKQRCKMWLDWQMNRFFREVNVLSMYFYESWLDQWFEKTHSLPAVLMVEKLCRGNSMKLEFEDGQECDGREDEGTEGDCMEAVKIHEMLRFVEKKSVVDERAVLQFRERYGGDMLDRVLNCGNVEDLLKKEEREKLYEIQNKIKGD